MAAKRVFQSSPSGGGRSAGPALGVEKNGLLWLAGLTAATGPSEEHAEPNTGDQMRDILGQADHLLRLAGVGPQDVVKTVDFLLPSGLPTYRGTGEARRDYFQESFPASTGILMEGLPQQGAMVSVDVVAHVGTGQRRETVPTDERSKRLTFQAAVEKGGILWVSGTTGRRVDMDVGVEVYPAELTAQVQIVYEKQLQALQEMDYSYDDVVKTVDYLTAAALPNYRQTAELRRNIFGNTLPVSTGIVVNRLLRPEALVEIDMVAVKGKREVVNPGWDRYQRLTYVPGILVNNLLFMSGFGALDPVRNEFVGAGDLVAQTEQTYLLVAAVVEAAGGSMADVVKVVEYLAPAALGESERVATVRRQFLPDDGYALSQTVVQGLLRPEMLIEVEAIAVLG